MVEGASTNKNLKSMDEGWTKALKRWDGGWSTAGGPCHGQEEGTLGQGERKLEIRTSSECVNANRKGEPGEFFSSAF